nr:uncharacterized protein CTRU02_15110 [Colletotrichum truncatum]XP_036575126.1 uncharacterized protein CTRU02_14945 [Colletotrichum truncatum]KAF6781403.1 hypothetical protein CTRU02_15110 [Colletotrichum truncatum]KAF6781647.1 hypothetical protein CTRU02_14945 [Colletotrichum truncatum]
MLVFLGTIVVLDDTAAIRTSADVKAHKTWSHVRSHLDHDYAASNKCAQFHLNIYRKAVIVAAREETVERTFCVEYGNATSQEVAPRPFPNIETLRKQDDKTSQNPGKHGDVKRVYAFQAFSE